MWSTLLVQLFAEVTVNGLFKIISVSRIFLIVALCTRGGHHNHLSNVKKAFQYHKQSLILIKQQPSGNPYLLKLLRRFLVEIFFLTIVPEQKFGKVDNTKQLPFDLHTG